ncbi:MAG TPA: hypothetical protein VMR18_03610 [Candidatus Saccharimonadales bacterium]|jgi:hypothetical protein|nr:hypothetical protein [Candidatus Saccharimonadales bacterium]
MAAVSIQHKAGELAPLMLREAQPDWPPEQRVQFGLDTLGLLPLEETQDLLEDSLRVDDLCRFVYDGLFHNVALVERLIATGYDVPDFNSHITSIGHGLMVLFSSVASETDRVIWTIDSSMPGSDRLTDFFPRKGKIIWNRVHPY